MAVNLAERYAKQIDQIYTHGSFFKGKANGKYEFTGGRGLKVMSPITVPMTPYDRDLGYGQLTRMENDVQEMIVTQDMKFGLLIDHGDMESTNGTMRPGARLRQQVEEQMIPTEDIYTASQYIKHAGKVDAINTAPTKSNILEMISAAGAVLDNHLVPDAGRELVIGASLFSKMRLADQIVHLEKIGSKAIGRGNVGELMGFNVVKVPDRYMPQGAHFMCYHRNSVVYPFKLNEIRLIENSETHSAAKLLGRVLYDAFVLGRKSGGVYVAVESASKQATPTIEISGTTATITSAGATSIKVTTDGSDPRYSESAMIISTGGTVTVAAGETVKAVAYGTFTSDVAEKTVS